MDPHALPGYARTTRDVADDLAEGSFGGTGMETGSGAAPQRQVRGVGAKADTLAASVSRTARDYRDEEKDIEQVLLGLLRDR